MFQMQTKPTLKGYFYHHCPLKSQVHYYSRHPSVGCQCLKPKFLRLVLRLMDGPCFHSPLLPSHLLSTSEPSSLQESVILEPATFPSPKHVRTPKFTSPTPIRRFICTLQLENHCSGLPKLPADPQICPALSYKCSWLPTFFYLIPSEVSYPPCFLLIFQVLAQKSLQKKTVNFPRIRKILLKISSIIVALICMLHQLKPFLELLKAIKERLCLTYPKTSLTHDKKKKKRLPAFPPVMNALV